MLNDFLPPKPTGRCLRRALATVLTLVLTVGGAAAAHPATAAVSAATVPAVPAAAPAISGSHTVTYDGYSMLIDGKRTYIWSGEFHYNRLPSPDLWRDTLQKMKAAGFNTVSIYFDWAYHSPKPGVYDFGGIRDVDNLLDMAAQEGIYVVARPGPYINAELDSGGFPAWVDTLPGSARSTEPAYLAAADEWLNHIAPILARHQLTNGTGSIIAYQIENEYYKNNDDARAYMAHLEKAARDHGITVPLTGNHNQAFATGPGAVDIDAVTSYPQGFNCSNPTQWSNLPNIAGYSRAPGAPLFTAEFQGGSFDPWGGPGYDKCRQLTGADFANVFYKNNLAVGATMQNLYMAYGGTSWGWQADPNMVYTSYDYGAAISEPRQLTDKYQQIKLIGSFLRTAQSLNKTDQVTNAAPSTQDVVQTVRRNPDDGTQFHFLRQADVKSTGTVNAHIAVDLTKGAYTFDDQDGRLAYSPGWTHVGAEQDYAKNDYRQTESWTETAGTSVSVPFTGRSVRWIASTAPNHGLADVYIDGTKMATVDGYSATVVPQQVQFSANNLTDAAHTLKIVATGQKNASASGAFVAVDAVDQPTGATRNYPSVPQQEGTAITLAGRESKTLVAGYQLGASRLQYSTSELMTSTTIGGRDLSVLYGGQGQSGETVLNFPTKPTVKVLSGNVPFTWNATTGDLRLNYQHSGLARVLVTGGQRPLLLLIGDTATAKTFWTAQSAAGPVLVRGSSLLRGATTAADGTLALTGDCASAGAVEVFAGSFAKTTWNGRALALTTTSSGSGTGRLKAPTAVSLPALTGWKKSTENPEAQPGFDDSSWTVADKLTSHSTTTPDTLPVLFTDEYGFHYGDVWYRAHFTGMPGTNAVDLSAITGPAGIYSVWLNGTFLGSTSDRHHRFALPAGSLKDSADNVLSVLLENSGHNEDWTANDSHKEARGLTGAALVGAPTTAVTWRIQGSRGGETLIDPARGPMNTGGLYGERSGWSLPGFPDTPWSPVTLPTNNTTPGVTWYRTSANLNLPAGQDTSVGLRITDDPARHYRALIFVNGWQLGRYINDLGPQHSFPIPNGILNPDGANSIALAVWNADGTTGGLGAVSLESYGTQLSPLTAGSAAAPQYQAATYASASPNAALALAAPEHLAPAEQTTVTATLAVPAGVTSATATGITLQAPTGWTVTPATAVADATVAPGTSATASWKVTAPSGTLPQFSALTAAADFQQGGAQHLADSRRVLPATAALPPTADTPVSALPFYYSANGWGPVERNTSNGEAGAGDGRTLSLNGKTFATGLGTHASSVVGLQLNGHCTRLTATVGIDDEVDHGSVAFSARADGRTLTTTPVRTHATGPTTLDVDITGAEVLELVAADGGDGTGKDHADWADAQLHCS